MTKKNNKGVGNKRAWAVAMKAQPCTYCGKSPAGTIDHVIRVRHGGKTNRENCVPACEPCNQARELADVIPADTEPSLSTWSLGEKLAKALENLATISNPS